MILWAIKVAGTRETITFLFFFQPNFCHTLTLIHHGCTCDPKHEPPSHLPPHNIPLGLFISFAHFLIGLFIFLVLSCMSCLYILEINFLSVVSFPIIFSHSESFLFTLLRVSSVVQNLLSLIRSHLFIFAFVPITMGGGSYRILL